MFAKLLMARFRNKLLIFSNKFYQINKRNYGKLQRPNDFFKHVNLHKDFELLYKNFDVLKKNAIDKSFQRFVNAISSIDHS